MSVAFPSTDGMATPVPYHHVAVGTGTRQVHVAGQIGRDPVTGSLPEDLRAQVALALQNAARGLAAADATFSDVVRLTVYVTGWRPERMEDLLAGFSDVTEELGLPDPMPPAALIGVEVLFEPGVLVEIEATAVLA